MCAFLATKLFWQSVDGGCSTEEEADAKWKALEVLAKEGSIVFDKQGPEKKPLRLAVDREVMVYNYNDVKKKRQIDFVDKPLKKVDEGQLGKMVKRVMSNHDSIGGSSSADSVIPDAQKLGTMMLQGGAGRAFDNANMNVGDVMNLLPSSPPADEPAPKTPRADEKEEDEGAETGKQPKKWFDKDRAVNQAQKALATQEKKLLEQHKQRVADLTAALDMIANLGPDEKRTYQGEERIASVRLKFLQALSGAGGELTELIEQFQVPGGSPMKLDGADNASTAGAVVALGTAPPCKRFAELKLLPELALLKDEVLLCSTAAEIVEHKKQFAQMKAPIMDLLSCSQAGLGMKAEFHFI